MQNIEFDAGGVTWKVEGPSTCEEYDSMAKQEGACLASGIANAIYRGTANDARDALIDEIVAKHGIAQRLVDHPEGKKKDGTEEVIKVIDPKDDGMKFIRRAAAELGYDSPKKFQALADEIMTRKDEDGLPLIRFDPSVREKGGSTKEPGPSFIEDAKAILAAGPEKVKVALGRISAVTGDTYNLTGVEAEDVRTLALAVRAYRQGLKKALLA